MKEKPKSIYQLSKELKEVNTLLNAMNRPAQTSRIGLQVRNRAFKLNRQIHALIKEAGQRAVNDNYEKYYIKKRSIFVLSIISIKNYIMSLIQGRQG